MVSLRHYEWKGRKFPRVTSIIGGGYPKESLVYWAAREAAEYAVNDMNKWWDADIGAPRPEDDSLFPLPKYMKLSPTEAAIQRIKTAPFKKRDAKANVGSAVHKALELHQGGADFEEAVAGVSAEHEGYVYGALKFLDHFDPLILATETTVYSRKHSYAGTLDMLAEVSGRGCAVIDFKTSKDAYPDMGLQLAAYANADFMVVDEKEKKLPKVDLGIIVILKPHGGYKAQPFNDLNRHFEAFLAAKQIWEHKKVKMDEELIF